MLHAAIHRFSQFLPLPLIAGGLLLGRGLFYLRFWSHPNNGQDFAAYWVAAWLLRTGDRRIYDPLVTLRAGTELGVYPVVNAHAYLYPPPLAQALYPLSLLPFASARLIWLLIGAALLLLALTLTVMASPPERRKWITIMWLALPFPYISLFLGQADTLVTALLAVGGIALARGRWHWTASAVALAGALKVTPLATALILLGRWSGTAWLLLSAGLILAAPFLLAGFRAGAALWLDFVTALPELSAITRDWLENVSLIATLRRLFLVAPHSAPAAVVDGLPALGGLILPPALEPALTLTHAALAIALLGLLISRLQRLSRVAPRHFTIAWLYSALILYVLLVAPITWPSTLSLLVIPATFFISTWYPWLSKGQILAVAITFGILWIPADPAFFADPAFYRGGFRSSLAFVSLLRTLALLSLFCLLLTVRVAAPAVERPDARSRLEAARLSS